MKNPAAAPWVRTRLRTAPGAALALALLVLLSSFLAAALPRAVDSYETKALRADIDAFPMRSVLRVSNPPYQAGQDPSNADQLLRAPELAERDEKLRALFDAPLAIDPAQSAHGTRNTHAVASPDPYLPRPDRVDPELTLHARSGLREHAKLREGRWPVVKGAVGEGTREIEGTLTSATAKALHIKTGSVVNLGVADGLAVRITGIVDPVDPGSPYWSVDPLLHTPTLAPKATPKPPPLYFWTGALLLPPEAGPAVLRLNRFQGSVEMYWDYVPDARRVRATDIGLLKERVAALESGPGLVAVREAGGDNADLATDLDDRLNAFDDTRGALTPIIAVAASGVGAVAAIVIAMAGGLAAARRRAELALLRSRGGSLRGIGGRLLAETSVVVLPAAALGLLLALLTVGDGRTGPSLVGAGAFALVGCLALPLRAVFAHRRPQSHGGREDVVSARPSKRRTVAELALLVLAVGAVAALRRRGTGGSTDLLVSTAPVLVGLIAALVLVRLYPLPLRLAARPSARTRGAVGFLSLARAGRAPAGNGALPLLALLTALTTAAFGGAVLAGIDQARDRTATLTTGADARISGPADLLEIPPAAVDEVRGTAGVRAVAPVLIEYGVPVLTEDQSTDGASLTLVGVEPTSYERISRDADIGPVPARELTATGSAAGKPNGDAADRTLTAIASPDVARRLGTAPRKLLTRAGDFTVRVVAVRHRTAAVRDRSFLVVNTAGLVHRQTTTLLVSGPGADPAALRAAAKGFKVLARAEERAQYRDSQMQSGARRIYTAAIGAGAGYAVLALLLSLLQTAGERTTLLARLRTMGLTGGQSRRLLIYEALPQALLAAVGGVLVGWATIALLDPGIDLGRLALSQAPGATTELLADASLRTDAWSLGLPALGLLVLAAAVAAGQAWWTGRRGPINELRAGDNR
ncbi:FtsX-like permease family protein [Streptomyces sp. NPDC050504]|uniref:FtsX-like permease family protein n=1 Tax=Streptomyces sp. NPDC050504 TaxID=3365618 RepID=UPI0037B3958F